MKISGTLFLKRDAAVWCFSNIIPLTTIVLGRWHKFRMRMSQDRGAWKLNCLCGQNTTRAKWENLGEVTQTLTKLGLLHLWSLTLLPYLTLFLWCSHISRCPVWSWFYQNWKEWCPEQVREKGNNRCSCFSTVSILTAELILLTLSRRAIMRL